MAWRVWSICHQCRPLLAVGLATPAWGRIDARLMLELCAVYKGSVLDLEKVLAVEEAVWPSLAAPSGPQ